MFMVFMNVKPILMLAIELQWNSVNNALISTCCLHASHITPSTGNKKGILHKKIAIRMQCLWFL